MIAASIELPAILQAGRWKSASMVNRYGERLLTKRNAAAPALVDRPVGLPPPGSFWLGGISPALPEQMADQELLLVQRQSHRHHAHL